MGTKRMCPRPHLYSKLARFSHESKDRCPQYVADDTQARVSDESIILLWVLTYVYAAEVQWAATAQLMLFA